MEFNETFDVPENAHLIVKNIRGAIHVGQGESGKIRIQATLDETTGNPERTRVRISQKEDGTVEAITDYERPSIWLGQNPSKVVYQIEAPQHVLARVRNVSGAILIEQVHGNHRIRNVSGNIHLTNIRGELDVKNVSGRIEAHGLHGKQHLESVSGRLHVERSEITVLGAKTVSGSQYIETALGDGPYRMQTISGGLRLVLDQAQPCTVNATSISGQFKSDLGNTRGSVSKRNWQLDFDGGGPTIRMKTISGAMRVLLDGGSNGSRISPTTPSRQDRIQVLNQVSAGELTVEDALRKL
jgi:hypothetical protein